MLVVNDKFLLLGSALRPENATYPDAVGALMVENQSHRYLRFGQPRVATRVIKHEKLFRDAPGSICKPEPNSAAEALAGQLRARDIALITGAMKWKAMAPAHHRELVSLAG